jgi:hypothetical protein
VAEVTPAIGENVYGHAYALASLAPAAMAPAAITSILQMKVFW